MVNKESTKNGEAKEEVKGGLQRISLIWLKRKFSNFIYYEKGNS